MVTDSISIAKDGYRLSLSRQYPKFATVAVGSGESGHAILLDPGEARMVARFLTDFAEGIRE
jgi:hypothetical protein